MAEPIKRLFTVSEYHSLADAGILTEDDHVELIDGEIFRRAASGTRHAGCVKRLNRLLGRGAGDRAIVGVRNPVLLDGSSEMEPDLSLLAPRPDDYSASHPTPIDVLLLIEVADTSSRFDRFRKLPVFTRNDVPEVWLVDLSTGRIEVYRDPTAAGYRSTFQVEAGETISPQAFPDLVLEVGEILV